MNFIDNHDQPRFASRIDNITSGMNAATFIMLAPGTPTIYDAAEQRLQGAVGPDNRGPLWETGHNAKTPLYQLVRRLNGIKIFARNSSVEILAMGGLHMALQHGPLVVVVLSKDSKRKAADNDQSIPTFFRSWSRLGCDNAMATDRQRHVRRNPDFKHAASLGTEGYRYSNMQWTRW